MAVLAKFNASSLSSIFGHNIPGVSNKSKPQFVLSQLTCLVTPGLLPTLATFLPANLFIRVLLPTLGTPTTPTFISFSFKP